MRLGGFVEILNYNRKSSGIPGVYHCMHLMHSSVLCSNTSDPQILIRLRMTQLHEGKCWCLLLSCNNHNKALNRWNMHSVGIQGGSSHLLSGWRKLFQLIHVAPCTLNVEMFQMWLWIPLVTTQSDKLLVLMRGPGLCHVWHSESGMANTITNWQLLNHPAQVVE